MNSTGAAGSSLTLFTSGAAGALSFSDRPSLPTEPGDSHLSAWQELQQGYLDLAESYFSPVPILQAPFYQTEVLGYDRLEELGRHLFADLKPEDVLYLHKPFEFVRRNGRRFLRLHLPFAAKEEIEEYF